jgi:tRNA(fMet)-specific endonuclease VapC
VRYFLDTDICVYALKGGHPHVVQRMRRHAPADIKIAAIVRAELLLGALKSQSSARTKEVVDLFLAPFEVVPFGWAAAGAYAGIRFALEQKGMPIGPNDLVLAATALSEAGCLVTHNVKEFGRVKGLRVEDWTR